jgi:hypothetical protein
LPKLATSLLQLNSIYYIELVDLLRNSQHMTVTYIYIYRGYVEPGNQVFPRTTRLGKKYVVNIIIK